VRLCAGFQSDHHPIAIKNSNDFVPFAGCRPTCQKNGFQIGLGRPQISPGRNEFSSKRIVIAQQTAKAYCTALTSVTVPASVTTIGQSAFAGCYTLTNAIVNNGEVGAICFGLCTNLATVTLARVFP